MNPKVILAAVLISISALSLANQQRKRPAVVNTYQGHIVSTDVCGWFHQKTFEEKRALCEEAIASGDYEGRELGELYFRLGFLEDHLKQWDAALANYDRAIELYPDRVSAHHNSGLVEAREFERYDIALTDFTNAISLLDVGPSPHQEAWRLRAATLFRMGRYEEALPDLMIAIELDPDKMSLFADRAQAFAEAGRYEEALEDLEKVLRSDPNSADDRERRAFVYEELERFEDAQADIDYILSRDREHDGALQARARLRSKTCRGPVVTRHDPSLPEPTRSCGVIPSSP